ncbi:MAG TPA: hypothetical protein VMT42_06640 [candidate division Zixibacteria bacterium]|nr:hypothetical protein [candidate division Zixibacteria bacterium]
MARYLILWHRNPVAPWPNDLKEAIKLMETMWVGIDNLMKMGEIKEFGWYLDGKSGYAIGEGESTTVLRDVSMFMPFEEFEIQEIIPWEKGKAAVREAWKILEEATK